MSFSRRDFGKTVLTSIPAASALVAGGALSTPAAPQAAERANSSNFQGVQIGVIVPYSYHGLPGDAESILGDLVECGISGCEAQSELVEPYAGAPEQFNVFTILAARGIRGGNAALLTPEEQAKIKNAADALHKWRQTAPMAKFKELRDKYTKAGVRMYGFKLQLDPDMPDWEFDYAFNAAKAVGADHLTMEMPVNGADGKPMRGDQIPFHSTAFKRDDELTARIGKFADKHQMMVGYHAHMAATATFWDVAMSQSKYNGINVDVGHYVAAGNRDLIEFVKKNHARMPSIHVKDRKFDGGPNQMWGQGDTPLVELFSLMRDEKYNFAASIELEYPTPAGSNSAIEIARCVAFAKDAVVRPRTPAKSS